MGILEMVPDLMSIYAWQGVFDLSVLSTYLYRWSTTQRIKCSYRNFRIKLMMIQGIHSSDNGIVVTIHSKKHLPCNQFTPARYGEQS